jgi:hypothetical protein
VAEDEKAARPTRGERRPMPLRRQPFRQLTPR